MTMLQNRGILSSTYLLRLYADKVHQHTRSFCRVVRFVVRTLFSYAPSTDWFRFIETHPILKRAPDPVKRILGDKIHRPFARCDLTIVQRIILLKNHYLFLDQKIKSDELSKIVADDRLKLAEFTGRNGAGPYVLTLSRDQLSQHQGELTILCIAPNIPFPVARLVFNFVTEGDDANLMITGIQGPGHEYKKDVVRMTRDLYGLRPKQVVFEAVCAVARVTQVKHVIAITKKNHVSQSKKKWQRKVVAEYDHFWQEFDPQILPSGDYRFSTALSRRKEEDVPGKRRKNWRLRYEVVDSLVEKTEQVLKQISI